MRRSAFTVARVCLSLGCLAALTALAIPTPRASGRFLAAHEARRSRGLPSSRLPETLLAGREVSPVRLREVFERPASGDRPDTRPTGVAAVPPPYRIAAGEDAKAPLSGLVPGPGGGGSGDPTVTLRVVEADPEVGLVPEPTPDPVPAAGSADGDNLASEMQALRQEVQRLAQAGGAPSGMSDELRRLTDELRETERFRRLEDELRRLRGGTGTDPIEAPEASPTGESRTRTEQGGSLPTESPGEVFVRTVPRSADGDRFDLQVLDADITHVLDSLAQGAGLNLVPGAGVTGPVTLNLRDVTFEEALDALLRPRDLVAERKDNLLFVLPRTEAVARAAASRTVVTKVYRPNYISVKDLQALVAPLLTATFGKSSITTANTVGLEISATDAGGDSLAQRDALVVQDYPEVIEQVDEVVSDMDVPPLQVVIEAYILRVRLDDEMRLGVNFAILNGSGKQLVTTGSGAGLATSTGFPGERESLVPALPAFLAPAAGLRYGFLQGDVTGFIEALEGIGETSLVASPSLRVLNKQKAELIIGQRLGYKTQTFSGQQTIENVEFLDVGTKLILRPFAAPDGLVRMEVHPERSSGVIDENGVPQVDTTEVTTNVMVRDGATVVIGGLIDEQTSENLSQVPVLGSLPVIGYAFRNTTEELIRSELIVLITPRIVCDPVEEARGEVLKAESERRAAFFSDNLSPVSRRNLARMHVERADELYRKGRLAEAHDHLREALAVRKNDGEALRLKAEIERAMAARRKRFLWLPNRPEAKHGAAEVRSREEQQPAFEVSEPQPLLPPPPAPDAEPAASAPDLNRPSATRK